MKKPRFAVIGAGSAGLAMAGHLSVLGYEVGIFNRTSERICELQKRGSLELKGKLKGKVGIKRISTRIEYIVPFAEVILVLVPAYAHQDIARLIGPFLQKGQTVLLMPGRTGGALEFTKTLEEAKIDQGVTIGESQTVLHTSRTLEDQSGVMIFALKKRVVIAALPSLGTQDIMDKLQPIFPCFALAKNTLSTGLANVGAILHPAPTLLNIGRIERQKDAFKYYHEGVTPVVAQFLELLDAERCSVAKAFGVEIISTQQWLYRTYGVEGANLYRALQNNEYYGDLNAPSTIRHRYLLEDVPTGLVPISELGKVAKVSTPNTDLIVQLASSLLRTDFRKQGRNLKELGLEGKSLKGIKDVFNGIS